MSGTPTLEELIGNGIRAELLDLHTMLPAKVEKYDPVTQKASISPLLKKKYTDGGIVKMPVINDVPVQWPSGGDAFIHMPLGAGDTGMAIFSERSLDKWLSGEGGFVLPDDIRHHDISDAIFIPGIKTFRQAFEVPNPERATIKNGNMIVEVDPSGKIKIEGATEELLTVIESLMTNLINATITIAGGSSSGVYPFTPATVTALTQNRTSLQTLKI